MRDSYRVGGIAGYNSGTIKNCYTAASVSGTANGTQGTGTNVYTGGIAGQNDGMIENCYALGDVSATASFNKYVGGIAGANVTGGTVRNCVALNGGLNTDGYGNNHFCRVAYNANGGSLTNNYGWIDMARVPSGSWSDNANWVNAGTDRADGAHCDSKPDDATFWKVLTTWDTTNGAAWDFSSVWIMGSDYPQFM